MKQLANYRWRVVALLLLLNLVNNMDRQVFALAGPQIQHDLALSELEFARLVEAFQFSFALACLASGRLVDWKGVRSSATVAIAWFSAAQILHIFSRGVLSLGIARVGLAIGEAPIYPATLKGIGEWAPRAERSAMAGAIHFGVMVGPFLAPLFVPCVTAFWGWQSGFVITGCLGLLLMGPFWWFYSKPEASTRVSAPEMELILGTRIAAGPRERASWLGLLGRRQTWVYIVIQSFVNPAWWFLVYWLPKFLGEVFGIRGAALTPYIVAVYGIAALGAVLGGSLSSALLAKGWTLNAARKSTMLLCGLAMPMIVLATHTRIAWVAVGVIGLAAVIHQTWTATGAAILTDLFPPRVIASVVGIGTFFGSAVGVLGAELIGRVLSARPGFYAPMFIYTGSAYLAATVVVQVLSPTMTPATDV